MIYPGSQAPTVTSPGMMLADIGGVVSTGQGTGGYPQTGAGGHLGLDKTEHPGLRGTPLAMLAAQCNKLSSMSPPPLADAAVGKGFHPWKKGGGSPEQAASPSPAYGAASGLYPFSTASTTSVQSEVASSQASLIGKLDPSTTAAHLQMQSMYSRVAGVNPYESWPFNVAAGASHIKSEVNGLQSPGSRPSSPRRNQHFCSPSSWPQTQNSHSGRDKQTFVQDSIELATNLSVFWQSSWKQPTVAPKPWRLVKRARPAFRITVFCSWHAGHSSPMA